MANRPRDNPTLHWTGPAEWSSWFESWSAPGRPVNGRSLSSMAEASTSEREQYKRDHPPGSQVTGVVTHVAPFGAFVDLGVPFAALLLVPYMAPLGARKSFPEDYPKVG